MEYRTKPHFCGKRKNGPPRQNFKQMDPSNATPALQFYNLLTTILHRRDTSRELAE